MISTEPVFALNRFIIYPDHGIPMCFYYHVCRERILDPPKVLCVFYKLSPAPKTNLFETGRPT